MIRSIRVVRDKAPDEYGRWILLPNPVREARWSFEETKDLVKQWVPQGWHLVGVSSELRGSPPSSE